jgi:hypothetical protein
MQAVIAAVGGRPLLVTILRTLKGGIDQPANGLGAADVVGLRFDPSVNRHDLPVMHPDDHWLTGARCLGSSDPGSRLSDTTN